MKRIVLFLGVFLALMYSADAQTTVFSENFDGATLSVTSSSQTGTNAWGLSSTFKTSGTYSDSATVALGDTTYLTTNSFATTGSSIVSLQFKHICKVDWMDAATIEISDDNGVTWAPLTGAHYTGASQFGSIGNKFAAHAYPIDWNAASPTAIPTSSWWKTETFNLSALVPNKANVKLRFALADAGGMGSNGTYGWLIDDILVTVPSQQEATAIRYFMPYALASGCGLGNETLQLTIYNSGGQVINGNLTASFQREGTTAVTETVTQSIPVSDSITYTFSNPINLTTTMDTNYQIKVWVNLVGDPNQTNDSLTDSIASRIPLALPIISNVTIPYGDSVLLIASHTDSIAWYSDPLAQDQIGFGSKYQTSILYDTITYYCQAGGGGVGDSVHPSTYSNTYTSTTGLRGYHFQAPSTFTILGLRVPTNVGTDPQSVEVLKFATAPNGSTSAHTVLFHAANVAGSQYIPCNITIQQGDYISINGSRGVATHKNNYATAAPITIDGVSTIIGRSWSNSASLYTSSTPSGTISRLVGGSISQVDFLYGNPGGGSADACPSAMKAVTVMISGIPQNDAGLTMVSPDGSVTSGQSYPIKVDLKNYGVQPLTKCSLNYSVNGVLQTPYLWTGNLPNDSLDYDITIGNETFGSGVYRIKAWPTMPNDSNDIAAHNDTIESFIYVCLSGTFTLGGASADFQGFDDLQLVIDSVGLCGNTVINILPGTYNTQLSYGIINGATDTSQLTLQSSTGVNTDVIIKHAATGTADNYVVQLNGSRYVNFKNITIEATGSTYAYGVHITNGAKYNTFDGNIIKSNLTTSSNGRAFVIYAGALSEYNTVSNNSIIGGYYGMYIYGTNSTTWAKGNVIKDNDISGFYYYGMMVYYQDSVQVVGNYIHDGINTYQYGIYSYYCYNGFNFSDNNIVMNASNYSYGLRIYYCNYNNTSADLGIVANNMIAITAGTGTNYGLYAYYSNNTYFVNNSVHIEAGGISSRALHQYHTTTGTGMYFKNNNFTTKAGYAAYYSTPAAIAYQDYNNYYSTGTYFAYYGGNVTDLAGLQTSSSAETNSVSVNPGYLSSTDLHASSANIDGKAAPDSLVTMDIDGDIRNTTTPDIGADEFLLLGDDAGILAMTSPTTACPGDTSNMIVTLRNFGTDTINTVTINWQINNVSQTAYSYSGTLLPGATSNIQIGTYIFQAGVSYAVDFWTTSPNGIADLQTSNDSLQIAVFKTSIPAGTYLIGSGTTADYVDFGTAISDLNAFGICGPVVFNVEDGTYAGNISIGAVLGTNSTNTITFQSLSGDSTAVIVGSASGTNLTFAGAEYVTFKGMSFISSSASHGIDVGQGANHNTVTNCIIQVPTGTSSAGVPVYNFSGSLEEFNTFNNNIIKGGYYAVYNYGSSTTSMEDGNVFSNNQIIDFYYYGMYNYYQNNLEVSGNTFINASNSGGAYGPRFYYCDGAMKIDGNTINITGTSTVYGLYMYYCDATNAARGSISNNMITVNGNATAYGLYTGYNYYYDFVYNTVVVNSPSTTRAAYIYGYAGHTVKNNNFINLSTAGTNYAIYGYGSTYPLTSDYNNFYVASGNIGYWSGAKATLTAWQTATNQDAHSISVLPTFFSATNLHTISSLVNGKGIPLVDYPYDIDGELRDTTASDIGADEFDPPAQEAALVGIVGATTGCGLDTIGITVKIANFGLDTISGNLMAYYTISGTSLTSESVTATILPGDTLTFTFTNDAIVTSQVDTNIIIKTWITLTGDPIQFNDTSSIVLFNGVVPPGPVVTGATVLYGTTATLTATSSNIIFWYDNLGQTTPSAVGTSYTTGILFATTNVYAMANASNGCLSLPVTGVATVTGIPVGDVGISALYVNEGCGLDTNETIIIDVYNQGTATVNANLTATFRVDNNAWKPSENITTAIPAGDTIAYTFNAKADLYAYLANDTFDIEAAVTLYGDPYQGNDTATELGIISELTPVNPVVTSPISIAYGAIPTLTATSTDTVYWYANPTDTVETGQGSSFAWPYALYTTDTFYVQAGGGSADLKITEVVQFMGAVGATSPYPSWIVATDFDGIEITNMGTGAVDLTGWTVNFYSTTATWGVNGTFTFPAATTLPPGGITVIDIKSAASVNNPTYLYFGAGLTGNPQSSAAQAYYIKDPAGTVIDAVATNGQAFAASTGVTAADWSGSIPASGGKAGVSRLISDNNLASDWGIASINPITQSLGSPNPGLGIVGGGSSSACASDMVPVIVNVAPPPLRDASAYLIVSPQVATQSGVPTPIIVKLKNYGTSTLTSTAITYELDGLVKATYNWTGSVAFGDTSHPVTIYTDTFAGGLHDIRAWVTGANGTTQTVNLNDTTGTQFSACLSGNYDIGGGTNDFIDIPDAIFALNNAGICGHVVFNVYPDTINGQLTFDAIAGVDANNTVTFQSANGDSTSVLIQYAATSTADNFVVKFDGAEYITLKGMSLKANGASYGYVVHMTNGTEHCAVENCYIKSGVTSSSNGRAVVLYAGAVNEYNTIKNNRIEGGYYGVYVYGTNTTTRARGNVIENNDVSGYYYYGMMVYYQDSVQVVGNYIHNGINVTQYGIYTYYIFDGFNISKNKIILSPSNYAYGMRVYYANYYLYTTATTATGIVSNNFISIFSGTGTNYGLYAYYCDDVEYYHNSVDISGGGVSSRSLHQYNTTTHTTGQTFINNIFSNTTGGYAAYYSTVATVANADYNDYYTTGTNFVYWAGNKTNLTTLTASSPFDDNSVTVNPDYISVLDLHINAINLNGTGYNVGILDDIDGDPRGTTPDIGADEYTPSPNDAGVVAITAPTSPVLTGSQAVQVTLRNYGSDTLFATSIGYSLNGVAGTSYSWTDTLLSGAQETGLNIGNATFTAGANILKAWSSMPNGQADPNNLNDTTVVTLIGCAGFLSGTYTIGGTGADFPDFSSAVSALNYCGVDSAVLFLVNSGTYTEQFEMTPINGASDTNTITFASAMYDSTSVILSRPSSGPSYTIYLNGADYVSFKSLTIESQTDARVVQIANNSNYITFENSIIRAAASTSSLSTPIYSSAGDDEFLTLRNNSIENGYYGVYLRGASSANLEKGLVMENNSITGYYYYGVYLYYLDAPMIDRNYIADGAANYGYAMYLYYCDNNMQISNNKFDITPGNYHYVMRLYYCDGTSTNPINVYNNFMSVSTGTGTNYGAYIYGSNYVNFVHNSINLSSGGSSTRGIYVSSGGNIRLLNNNIVSNSYTYYISSTGAVVQADYNNLHSTGGTFAYWGGNQVDLAALQTASSKEAHSMSVDPQFYGTTDLHITSPILNDSATPLTYVVEDIDRQVRSTTTPDIGADEFTPAAWDVIATALIQPTDPYGPQNTNINVEFSFKNIGLNAVTSMTIGFIYNGTSHTHNWSGNVPPGANFTHLFTGAGSSFSALLGTKDLKVFTALTNDANTANDTIFASFTGVPMISPDYVEDFDVPPYTWAEQGGVWEHGMPNSSTISGAHSGSNAWVTNLTGAYPSNTEAYLYTPYFDFSNDTGMVMSFYHFTDLLTNDGGIVEYKKASDSLWSALGYIGDPASNTGWYNVNIGGLHVFQGTNSGWMFEDYYLGVFNNEISPVQFRFRLHSDASGALDGWAIDDFKIVKPRIQFNSGVIAINQPSGSTVAAATITVEIEVKNFGYDTLYAIPVEYELNASTWPETINIPAGLYPDSTHTYTFTTTYTSPLSDYTIYARTNLNGDTYTSNDELSSLIQVTTPALDVRIDSIIPMSNPDITALADHQVTVWIVNEGTTPLTSIPVELYHNALLIATETWTGPALNQGAKVAFTFTATFNANYGGNLICAKTMLVGDADPTNDEQCSTPIGTGLYDELENGFIVWQNIPNPAGKNTTLMYEIPTAGDVVIEITDMLGQTLSRQVESNKAGRHMIDLNVETLASGVYYYTVTYDGQRVTRKMIVNR